MRVDVGTDEIIGLEADLFAPCALGGVINDETIPRLKAPIVAGATNNQLTALRHGEALHARGILYAPDYVINAGGVIDIAHEGPDYNPDKVLEQAGGIYDTILNIFRRAEEASLPPHIIADRIAEERFQRV